MNSVLSMSRAVVPERWRNAAATALRPRVASRPRHPRNKGRTDLHLREDATLGVICRWIIRHVDQYKGRGHTLGLRALLANFRDTRARSAIATGGFSLSNARGPNPAVTVRLAFCGDLTPQTEAADLFQCAVVWAEKDPNSVLSILWVGDGILRRIFAAQPLPENMSQHFVGRLEAAELTDALGEVDVIFVADCSPAPASALHTALTCRLPVIADGRCEMALRQVLDGQNGWLFDPRQPESLSRLLRHALVEAAPMRARLNAERDTLLPKGPG